MKFFRLNFSIFVLAAHNSAIVGVHVNNVNRILVTVAGGEMRFWKFADNRCLLDTLSLDEEDSVTSARFSKFHDNR